jgi:putative heme iron utilization protein
MDISARHSVREHRGPKTLFLHESTRERLDQLLDQLPDTDQTIYRTDVQEAALLVGLDHRDEVIQQLESWGYETTDEN